MKLLSIIALPILITISIASVSIAGYLSDDFDTLFETAASIRNWEIYEETGATDGPADWSVKEVDGQKALFQGSNIYTSDAATDSPARATWATYVGGDWADLTLELDMYPTDDDIPGVMFRYVDENNFYVFDMNGQANRTTGRFGRLRKCVNGKYTELDRQNQTVYTLDAWLGIKVEAVGNNIEIYTDGNLLIDVEDNAFDSGTIGVSSWGMNSVAFDNISVDGALIDDFDEPGANSSSQIYTATEVSGNVSDTQGGAWTLAGSPYIVTSDIVIPAGQTLTINPGVIVKFNNHRNIIVYGSLNARGTASSRVVFTSNGDLVPDWWGAIHFYDGTSGTLDYCDMSYSGYWNDVGIKCMGNSSPTISNSTISHVGGDGIRIFDAASPKIINTTISNTIWPVHLWGWQAKIADFTGSTCSNNVNHGFRFESFTVPENQTITWEKYSGTPPHSVGSFVISGNGKLIIEPGLIVKMDINAYIGVYGNLTAQGTGNNRITFTSSPDDIGGDTNADGSETTPQWDNWNAIFFYNDSSGSLDYCDITYTGYWDDCAIKCVGNTAPSISNCRITHVNGDGIRIYDTASPSIINTTISDILWWPVHLWGAYANVADFTGSECLSCGHYGFRFDSFSVPEGKTTVWKKYSGSPPYSVPTFTIGAGAKLDIDPGVIVKMDINAFIGVYGNLMTQGTGSNRVTFTSWPDDIGGDTNGDKGETTPQPDNWNAIFFYDGSSGSLDYCDITYGGYWDDCAIKCLGNSAPDVTNCQIKYVNGDGIRIVDSAAPSILNTTISDILWWPVHLWGAYANVADFTGSQCLSCGNYGFRIDNFSVPEGKTTAWKKYSGSPPYSVPIFTIGAGAKLDIDPGVIVKMDINAFIGVYGNLDARGTSSVPVIFTSSSDDIGGDTNANGADTSPEPDNWNSIIFYNDSYGTLDHCRVKYPGYWDDAGIQCLGNSAPTISNCEISNILGDAVRVRDTSNPTISPNNAFVNISDHGVRNFGSATVNARNNWWDHVSGPYHATKNPNGKGNKVSDNVDFSPYMQSAPVKETPSSIVVNAPPASIPADGSSTWTITISVKDASGKPLTGQDVKITTTNGLGTISGVRDNGDGTYSATFTASNQPGTEIIKITTGGVTQTTSITLNTPTTQPPSIVVNTPPASIPADGSSTWPITVSVKDASGKPLTGQNVRISTTNGLGTIGGVQDNGDGTYSATFTASNQPGTEIINITTGGVTKTVTITLNASVIQPPSLTAFPTNVKPGDTITVTFSNAPGNAGEWIGMYFLGPLGDSMVFQKFLDGNKSGTFHFTAIAQLGNFDFRMHDIQGQLIATSNIVTISDTSGPEPGDDESPSLHALPTSVKPGETITVTFSNAPGNYGDWIGIYHTGDSDYSDISFAFLEGYTDGTVTLEAPAETGEYDFRMFPDANYEPRLATSNVVTVTTGTTTQPALSASPASVNPGAEVTVSFSNAPGNARDWIGLYKVSATDRQYITWQYLNSEKSGSLKFTTPQEAGDYNFRMFPNDGYSPLLATSNTVKVTGESQVEGDYNGHHYVVVNQNMTWPEAKSYAESIGGYLATIGDEGENKFVADLAGTGGITGSHWIGLSDDATEGTFSWVTGEPVAYTSWYSGEPNDLNGAEEYAEMGWHSTYTWNDAGISQTRPFIVESGESQVEGDYNGHRYVLVNQNMTWPQAKSYAESIGGYLVTIGDEGENKFVNDLARTAGITDAHWIGFSDEATEGTFVWVTGEPVTYTNWNSGEPNNAYGAGESYGEFWYNTDTWNDAPISETIPFVVEFGDTTPVTPAGLVSLWKFDEGSGTKASDSADSNPGTVNGAVWTTGIIGDALSFDGVNDHVLVPDAANLDLTNQFTLEAWVNPASAVSSYLGAAIISKVGGAAGDNGYQFGLTQGNKQVFCIFNAAGETWPANQLMASPDQPVPVNKWSHIACTYDNSVLKIYLNGALIGSKTIGSKSVVNSSSSLYISGDGNNHAYFHGLIDEAAVYNTALSAGEIQKHYTDVQTTTTPSGLVSYWKLDEGSGTTASDSADSNPGTVNGAVWTTGIIGNALSFDGVNDHVLVPDAANLDLTKQFTLEAWINPASVVASSFGAAIISKVGGAAGNNGYQFGLMQGSKQVFCNFNAAGEPWPTNQLLASPAQPIPVNKWSHIACTYDNSVLRAYLNGALIGSKTIGSKSVVNSSSDLVISGDGNNHGYFHGLIDEAAVYNTALSSGEIQKHYADGQTTKIPTGSVELTIPEVSGTQGGDVTVPINISDAANVAGADITIVYDENVLTVKEVKTTTLSSSLSLVANTNTPGEIIIRTAGSSIASGSGSIIDMIFTIGSSVASGTETVVSLDSAEVFDGLGNNISATTQNGKVTVGITCLKGDVSGDGRVKSNDAILALRLSAGLSTPTPQQLCAADMNDDGKLRSNDAILILRKSAGLSAPEKDHISKIVTIAMQDVYGISGESVVVPISVDESGTLAGGDICISYDSSVLQPVEVISENKAVIIAANLSEAGKITLSFAGIYGQTQEVLTKLRFDVLSDSISPLIFQSAELYSPGARSLKARAINGKFTSYLMRPKRSGLLQNFPNPFNPETWIPYQLAHDSDVKIRIYSVSGEIVREVDLGYKPAGVYLDKSRAAYWDGRNHTGEQVSSGIYFYSIQAGNYGEMKKMIISR